MPGPLSRDLDRHATVVPGGADRDALWSINMAGFKCLPRVAQKIEYDAKKLFRIGINLQVSGNPVLQHHVAGFGNSRRRRFVDQRAPA